VSLKGVEPGEEHRNETLHTSAQQTRDCGNGNQARILPSASEKKKKKRSRDLVFKTHATKRGLCVLAGFCKAEIDTTSHCRKRENLYRDTAAGGAVDVIKAETRYEASSRYAQSLSLEN
jgi:hypothetical protein